MKKNGSTGLQFETGGHATFREDLVSWPIPSAVADTDTEAAADDAESARRPATPSPAPPIDDEDVRAQLAFATGEVRRLRARVQELVEENEHLSRQMRAQLPRSG